MNSAPTTWKTNTISNLSRLITKGATPTTYGHAYVKRGIRFYRSVNASSDGRIKTSDLKYITNEADEMLSRSSLRLNDLVMSIVGAPGDTFFHVADSKDLPGNINQNVALIRCKEELLNSIYLKYWLQTDQFRKQRDVETTVQAQPSLSLGQVGSFSILLPEILEQAKIAEILNSVDNVIDLTEKEIEKLQILKKGMMQDLLTKGIGHTQFKNSPVGRIPESWEWVRLLDIVDIQKGQVDPKLSPYKEMVLIAPNHVESATGRLLSLETAESQNAISGKYLCPPQTVIFSKIRPKLKKAVFIDFECTCSADMYPFLPSKKIIGRYLLYTLLGENFSIFADTVSERSNIPKINREELSEYKFPLPPIEEQNKIAASIFAIDSYSDQKSKYHKALKNLKKALMADLLTGKVRVKV